MKVKSESEVAQSGPTLATLWTAAYQAPLSAGFSRQEYWSGVPLSMKVKEESEKVGSKLNIQKTKIMTSGPINSWQIDGETVKTVTDFILWAPKSLQMVTAAMKLKYACSWKKIYDQPKHHFKKQRHLFANKISLAKAMVFPVVMYGCESWTIRKVEC